MKTTSTSSFASRLTALWGRVIGGIAGGFFLVGGVLFLGFGLWAFTCRLDWSRPDWTKVGVLLMGPVLIGATLVWAAFAKYKTLRNHFRKRQEEQQQEGQVVGAKTEADGNHEAG